MTENGFSVLNSLQTAWKRISNYPQYNPIVIVTHHTCNLFSDSVNAEVSTQAVTVVVRGVLARTRVSQG